MSGETYIVTLEVGGNNNNLFKFEKYNVLMCISKEDRIKREIKYNNPNHIIQRFHERSHLFGGKRMNDMLIEAIVYLF